MPDENESTQGATRQARGSAGQPVAAGLARQLSELAREMQAETDMSGLLKRITEAAVSEVDSAHAAGISIIDAKTVRAEAATDELVNQLDELQSSLGEGPCLNSLTDEVTVRVDDYQQDTRWPSFAAAAVEHGVRSMLSVQLFVEGDNLGALNLYAPEPDAFSDEDETIAMLLASHAAIAMKGSRSEANLRLAVSSRDVIGQAKGILMERFKIGASEAFNLLILTSQHTHTKLRDVADSLAATGELPIS